MFGRWRRDEQFRKKATFIIGVSIVVIISQTLRVLAASPATTPFQHTWERPDQPVAAGMVSRTWMWGPEAFTEAMTEPYAESPGGERTVQYFDSRAWRSAIRTAIPRSSGTSPTASSSSN